MDHISFLMGVLKKASSIAQDSFGKVQSWTKENDNNQVVTKADLEIGKYLISEISKIYQGHNILDEEQGVVDNSSEYTWVIDPIDGTSNFANAVPTYGIIIGLLQHGDPIAGGIALPYFSDIFTAQKDKGAFKNDKIVHVSNERDLMKCLVAYGLDGHQEMPEITIEEAKLLANIVLGTRNLRNSNSVYDVALVAEGKYAAALNRSSRIWDNVAQHIIIEEAGGLYTDFFGNSVDYSNPLTKADENFTFSAASPEIHRQLQAIIKS